MSFLRGKELGWFQSFPQQHLMLRDSGTMLIKTSLRIKFKTLKKCYV